MAGLLRRKRRRKSCKRWNLPILTDFRCLAESLLSRKISRGCSLWQKDVYKRQALDTTVTQRIAQALLGGRFVAEEMAGNLAEAAAQQEDPMLQELAEYMRSIAL